MEAIIQHNVKNGLGDYTNVVYRYFNLVEKMKLNGFTKIGIHINMKYNIMFDKDFFFKLYNRFKFEKMFDNISISDVPISGISNWVLFSQNSESEVGMNQFDIFMDQNCELFDSFKNNLHVYNNENEITKEINFFSDYVIDRYHQMNIHKDKEYKSLHFRAKDSQDNVELYVDHEEEFKDLIFNQGKIFICSNSYKFKEYIKSFNSENVFMYDLPFEKQFGNNTCILPFSENFGKNEYEDRTIDAAVESLTISDSNEVFSFNYFGKVHSNFLNIAKWKNVKINIVPLKNGMNWTPLMT